ncbi:hypothetical protein [Sporisorium scitamineum]|nr:hypothetical protein [Sporisorium scitamineum]
MGVRDSRPSASSPQSRQGVSPQLIRPTPVGVDGRYTQDQPRKLTISYASEGVDSQLPAVQRSGSPHSRWADSKPHPAGEQFTTSLPTRHTRSIQPQDLYSSNRPSLPSTLNAAWSDPVPLLPLPSSGQRMQPPLTLLDQHPQESTTEARHRTWSTDLQLSQDLVQNRITAEDSEPVPRLGRLEESTLSPIMLQRGGSLAELEGSGASDIYSDLEDHGQHH